MHFNKVDPTINEHTIPEKTEIKTFQQISDGDISIDFVDENNIVEKSDILYSSDKAKSLAQPYLKFLDKYTDGKHTWTQALIDMVKNVIHLFNESNKTPDNEEQKPKSTVAYTKDNKIASTYLERTDGGVERTTYKYRSDGSLDTVNYEDDKVIDYRKDGTRFSLHTTNIDTPEVNIKYDTKGQMVHKTVADMGNFQEIKLENGQIIEVYSKNRTSAKRTIYNKGIPVLITDYDKLGRITNYSDKYFGERLYNESPIDGRIDAPIRQGTSGTCYIAGLVNSLTFIPKGRELLDEVSKPSKNGDGTLISFPGLNRRYYIEQPEISHNMSRLGRRDADYPALVRAFEEFRQEDLTREDLDNLPEYFFHRDKHYGRVVDSGYPTEIFYALTGKEMNQSDGKITNKDLLKARQCLESGNGVVNAGTIEKETNNFEIPLDDKKLGVVPKHNLAVKKISDRYVTLYDSVTENIIQYPIEKFKKYFATIFYAKLD